MIILDSDIFTLYTYGHKKRKKRGQVSFSCVFLGCLGKPNLTPSFRFDPTFRFSSSSFAFGDGPEAGDDNKA